MQHQNAKQFRKWEKWGEIEVNSEIKVCDLGIGQKEVFRELEWSLESPHLLSDLLQQVMSELDQYFFTRGRTYLSGQRKLLEHAARAILGAEEDPSVVIPLLPGVGKSTLLRSILKVLARQFAKSTDYATQLGGVIIVVEKTAEAYELRDLINSVGDHLAHVLEGPNDFNIAHGSCLRGEVAGYMDCPGRSCPDGAACPVLQSAAKANQTPFLILMHARYQAYISDLTPFRPWVSPTEQMRCRNLLIVDEAPALLSDNRIAISEIANLEIQISRLKPSYQRQTDYVKSGLLLQLGMQLRQPFHVLMRLCRERFGRLGAVDADLLKEAGFDWDALDSFTKQLAHYAGCSANSWIEKLRALRTGRAVFMVGQEKMLVIPTCLTPDTRNCLRSFILSGSASLSPELVSNPDFRVLEGKLDKSNSHLSIYIQHTDAFATSKTAMQRIGNRKALAAWLRYRLAQIPEKEKVLVVTYKSYAAELWNELSDFHDQLIPLQSDDGSPPKPYLPYFGGMNGSNQYRAATYVICAGLGRFEFSDYLNRALAFDFDGKSWNELQQSCQQNAINDASELLCVKHAANLTLARDLVQLVFRSALRNHSEATPVTLWLVQPPSEVVMLVKSFFSDCVVIESNELPTECLIETAAHRTVKGKLTHAAQLLQWLKEWDGAEISVAEIQHTLKMTPTQWKEARKNEVVRSIFEQQIQSRRLGKDTLIRSANDADRTHIL